MIFLRGSPRRHKRAMAIAPRFQGAFRVRANALDALRLQRFQALEEFNEITIRKELQQSTD